MAEDSEAGLEAAVVDAEPRTEGALALALDESALGGEPANDGDESGERRRRKRRSRARAKTISIRRLSKTELNRGREEFPEMDYWRPQTRAECSDMERPCPFVSCKYHLYIDVHPVRSRSTSRTSRSGR
jgi:hypothetical protein